MLFADLVNQSKDETLSLLVALEMIGGSPFARGSNPCQRSVNCFGWCRGMNSIGWCASF